MLPNLSTLAPSPGNALVRCPECASLFRRASSTGCSTCSGKRKREVVPDPNDPNMSEQWSNAYRIAGGGAMSESGSEPPEPWQIDAAKRKLEQPDPDRPTLERGCAEEDRKPQDARRFLKEDHNPKFASLGAEDSEDEARSLFPSLANVPEEHRYPPFADTCRLEHEQSPKFRAAEAMPKEANEE